MEIDIFPRWVLDKFGVPSEVQPHVGLFLSSILVLLSPLLLKRIPHFCLTQRYLHIPCPGCGVMHSMVFTLRLNFAQAWHLNPAGIFFVFLLCFQITAQPLAVFSGRTRPAINQLSRRGSLAIMVCLISVWILKLFFGDPHNVGRFLSKM